MKPFIPTIAILLPLFFFAACGPSKNPEATTSASSPAAPAATITASPNPVTTTGEAPGATTIIWNTGDGTQGEIYVSRDGGSETLFTTGPKGADSAPWIQLGTTYEFRLYAGTEHAKVLAKTQVTGRK